MHAFRTRRRARAGFSLVELMIGCSVVAIAGMAGVAYVGRAASNADAVKDRLYARQKALSILSELRAYVEGGKGEVAADLDGFDDGLSQNPTLSITPDPKDPGAFIAPDHPLSDNVLDQDEWRWFRRITVQRFPGVNTRDVRICTVRVFRHRPGGELPGETMAEVATVVRTIGDAYPTTQVYDVYLLALESVPGWWVFMDSIKPFIDATLADLEARNPGLEFRSHWVTTAAYGRDEDYAPYTNDVRSSTDSTPWAYVYPGKMPAGSGSTRYYVPSTMRGRVNLDGDAVPAFDNDYALAEPYTDVNGNGERDPGEPYTDVNGNGTWDAGNPVPYAIADQFNHAMRWPEENAKFAARVAAGTDVDDTPTWRLLLDRMIADPSKYHNSILINLHGELLPMPPVRNYSDSARDPQGHPGWRVVTHPELLRPRRAQGSDANSDAPRWRVYGYLTEFPNPAWKATALTTQREPFDDLNGNGTWDAGEPYADWNGDGVWSDEVPITLEIPGIDCSANPNGATNPTLLVKRLSGGIDADGKGGADPYVPFGAAPRFPEPFTDTNGDGHWNAAEPYFDRNGNGSYDVGEPFTDLDGDGKWSAAAEPFTDLDGNGRYDRVAGPADTFVDTNGNGVWDGAEPFFDINNNGVRDGPTVSPKPAWRAWIPATDDANAATRAAYAANYGEPFTDLAHPGPLGMAPVNGVWDPAEPLTYDNNGNGVFDGGFDRGEMWFEAAYDSTAQATVVTLHGTPLLCPETADGRGLDPAGYLYDLEYVPCPMINTASALAPPFERDLANATANVPKNTARWTVEVPLAQLRKGFETTPGANNGDASDRILEVRTRLGADRSTGTRWPARNRPEDVSRAWSYFYATTSAVPFSERYQFQGDPRHCPYADLDRYAGSWAYPNGYNWYFDNFQTNGNATGSWLAFDPARLKAGWLGRQQIDTARYFSWLRTALTKTEAVWTTITGFSYYYMSVGGDVGYDSANGYPSSIPMDGRTFGVGTDVYEDTIAQGGTSGVGQCQKYVRSNDGGAADIRTGGYWWSKPWLGELYRDDTFAGQWVPWGNLSAATGANPGWFHQIRREDISTAQQPVGTDMIRANARTEAEGCTSLFNIGTASSTFHHQYQDGTTGSLTGDGPQLATNYNFPMPTSAYISRPFGLATSSSGGVGDEFGFTTDYPRYSASTVVDYYNHTSGAKGAALVRLVEPGASPRAAFIVVNGLDRTTGSGTSFIARYSMLSLVQSFFAAGVSGTGRIKQLPRPQILSPTIVSEISNPASIPIQWKTEWKRWDGLPYTSAYASTFAEQESDLVYVLLYSRDGGGTWLNMRTNEPATLGILPWIDGVGPDPLRTIPDAAVGNESWTWNTPASTFPEGTYMIRLEAYRKSEARHYAQHMEKIYVNR